MTDWKTVETHDGSFDAGFGSSSLEAACDGPAGIQELAGHATRLSSMTEEAQEGRHAFVAERKPDVSQFPWRR